MVRDREVYETEENQLESQFTGGYHEQPETATILQQINPAAFLAELEYYLKGYVYNQAEKTFMMPRRLKKDKDNKPIPVKGDDGNVLKDDNDRIVYQTEPANKPLANDDGINAIMLIVRSVVNTNIIMSNFNEDEIRQLIHDTGVELTFLVGFNWEQFEIDKANMRIIIGVALRMCYAALKRAYKAGEKDFLRTTQKSIERVDIRSQYDSQGKKRGLMDTLFGKRG